MNRASLLQDIADDPIAATSRYYAGCLHEQKRIVDYLRRQALDDPSRTLGIGFSDRTLGKQLPSNRVQAGRDLRARLQTAGILRPTGHETFRGFVTVPLWDTHHHITGIFGVRVDRSQGDQQQVTIGEGVFNASALDSFDELILCRNIPDAWAFYAAGHRNAVAWEQLQPAQLQPAQLQGKKRLLIADPDCDVESFTGIEVLRITIPGDASAHDFAKSRAADPDALGKRIRAATWIGGTPAPEAAKQETPLASPIPKPIDDIEVVQSEHDVTLRMETRRYRIRGLDRNPTLGVLKVNVMVYNERNDRFHVDTLDLCHARSRRVFIKECGEEIAIDENTLRSDFGRVLLQLEQLQVESKSNDNGPKPVELTDAQRSEALELLRDEKLLDRILEDFETCGIVGERIGKLAGYLAATSRLLPKPLGLVIQSSSAAGKTSLMNAVLALMPPESQFVCSAMTSQSLYYAANIDLRHKLLSIAEEEGARRASYALKLLQSEGKLSIVTTAKENGTGRTILERYDVEGPVATLMTTTASDVDPELMNRCFVIGVDEDADQTAAIQARQRLGHTIEDQLAAERTERRCKVHHNAQRLLQPVRVNNPYVDQLRFPHARVRDRRDNQAYMTLIDSIALLHQFQRQRKSKTLHGTSIEYIDVVPEDIAVANMIVGALMGSSIDDLPTQTRRLLLSVHAYVDRQANDSDIPIDEVRFTRRELREALGWGQTQLKHHLDRLAQYEYVLIHPGPGRTLRYELRFDGRGREGEKALDGLTDSRTLAESTTAGSSGATGPSSGQDHESSPQNRPLIGP